jgi:hypothetical protein
VWTLRAIAINRLTGLVVVVKVRMSSKLFLNLPFFSLVNIVNLYFIIIWQCSKSILTNRWQCSISILTNRWQCSKSILIIIWQCSSSFDFHLATSISGLLRYFHPLQVSPGVNVTKLFTAESYEFS